MKRFFAFFDEHSRTKLFVKLVADFLITIFSYLAVVVILCFLNNKKILSLQWDVVIYTGLITSGMIVFTWNLVGKHRYLWRGTTNRELIRFIVSDIYLFSILFVISKLLRYKSQIAFVPGGTMLLSTILLSSIISMSLVRFIQYKRKNRSLKIMIENRKRHIMIVGAGWAGTFAITAYKNGDKIGKPVVVVDDDPAKINRSLIGVPVVGNTNDIPKYVKQYNVSKIIIAITNLQGEQMSKLINICKDTDCKISIMSKIKPYGDDENSLKASVSFREPNIADFLSREEVRLDTQSIEGYLKGKRIVVTGGGGSIGSELCRQILKFHPEKIIIFDIYENSAYELQQELIRTYGKEVPIKVLIGSVRDKKRLDEIFETEKPSIVFHAAAHKHVPLMEESPAEAIKNNVIGTYNLLLSASEHNVERFVQISTDKAVNPTNVMGATKRMCEMLTQCFAKKSDMKCMAVRFGNVLGSHGSVIPLFEAQIKNGGPVTITHPDIIRYFMTIPEAAQLVLQAGSTGESGQIYVLDMGEPVKIKDLAYNLIRFYGYEPDVDIKIEYTGLRPGEKLYEELLMDEEEDKMVKTGHEKIFVAHPFDFDEETLMKQVDILEKSSEHNNLECVKALASVITTFHPDYERNN